MPKSSPAKLAYQKARNAEPEQKRRRALNNNARREAIREGRASVGDGTNVDHKKPLDAGGTNAKSNRRVVSESENKAWRAKRPSMYGKGK